MKYFINITGDQNDADYVSQLTEVAYESGIAITWNEHGNVEKAVLND